MTKKKLIKYKCKGCGKALSYKDYFNMCIKCQVAWRLGFEHCQNSIVKALKEILG